jgi:hypothetical protein
MATRPVAVNAGLAVLPPKRPEGRMSLPLAALGRSMLACPSGGLRVERVRGIEPPS